MARVVHLTSVHPLRDPRIFYKEVGSLKQAGFDVHLVAQHPRSEVVEGVPVTALTPTAGRYRRLPLLREAYLAARDLSAALYHLHDPELIPVGYFLKRHTGARIIYDMHEDYLADRPVEGRLIRALERWCFTWVDHVVVANASQMQVVQGAPATYIGNYFKPPDAAPEAAVRRGLRGGMCLLYAGVLSEERGLSALLNLAEVILQERLPWQLLLAGICYRAGDRRRAERRIERDGLDRVVRRVGWDAYVPWKEMVPFYEAAQVGLALWTPRRPPYQIPTKFYEYLHYGLPILCSDAPRWRQFVETHGCGAVVDPGRPEAVLRRLQAWHEDPALYAGLAAAGREVARHYHWTVMESRLIDLYRRVLAAPPR